MRITKLRIKKLFGIKSYEASGKNLELTGDNGTGKTSVIDAIRYALTNKSNREFVIRNGETEGEVLIETDAGLSIHRKARANQADYKSIKENGKEVPSPENFLRNIFTELQLNPIEFMSMKKEEQNRIILDMIEFNWDLNWIKEQFGEIVPGVNYDQNILSVLYEIQSENGHYFTKRQDLNREARNKTAFIEEIGKSLPVDYKVDQWRNVNLSTLYREIETIKQKNSRIEKAKQAIANKQNKVRAFEAGREIEKNLIDRQFSSERETLEKENILLENQLKNNKERLGSLEDEKINKMNLADETFRANVAEFEAEVKTFQDVANEENQDVTPLIDRAEDSEKMKSFINEYDRMVKLQSEVEEHNADSGILDMKIAKARNLPGIILETANIPIKSLTVKDGIPLINGLPISNLSEGEKLDLCIDIATRNTSGLNILLIDGVEKLSPKNRSVLYKKLSLRGVQFIATCTTGDPDLTVVELPQGASFKSQELAHATAS